MKISYMVLGPYQTNTYIVWDEETKNAIVIDPSFTPENIQKAILELGVCVQKILITHAHVDHIAGLGFLREKHPKATVYMHAADLPYLKNRTFNLSDTVGLDLKCEPPDVLVKQGDHITMDSLDFEVLETPGHTPGGVSYYEKNSGIVFTGDTLFQESIGRTDFPGGSMTTLIMSVKNQLFTLPDETYVLSGHGDPTTIEREKKYNPFLQGV